MSIKENAEEFGQSQRIITPRIVSIMVMPIKEKDDSEEELGQKQVLFTRLVEEK